MDQTEFVYQVLLRTSDNAVRIQVWIAISVYVLVAIVRKELGVDRSLSEIFLSLAKSVCRFRDQAALRTGSGNTYPGSALSRRQPSSSPLRRAASSAAKASTPCGDQLIPWCLQRADTAQSLYFSTRVLAIHSPASCRCW